MRASLLYVPLDLNVIFIIYTLDLQVIGRSVKLRSLCRLNGMENFYGIGIICR